MKRRILKKLLYFSTILIFTGFLLITCEDKPTEVSQIINQSESATMLKTNQDLGPHAKLSVEYLKKSSKWTEEQIKSAIEMQREFGIESGEESSQNDVKLISPEEFDKYNISPPTELELLKRGLEIAAHSKTILVSKSQQGCGDCSDCHEAGGQPGDWYYWTTATDTTIGSYKYVYPETVSESETFCLDRIYAKQDVYLWGEEYGYAVDDNPDDYIAGIYGVLYYWEGYSNFFQIYGLHKFEDIDFENLEENTYYQVYY